MVRYFHQNWLLDCPYESVNLNDYVVALTGSDFIQDMRHEWNLFDYNQREFTRKVDVSLLDDTTDSPDDWQKFLLSTENLDKLVLRDDRKRSNNKIHEEYLYATLQAYVWHLREAGIRSLVLLG